MGDKRGKWESVTLPSDAKNVIIAFDRETALTIINKFAAMPLNGFDDESDLQHRVYLMYGGEGLIPDQQCQDMMASYCQATLDELRQSGQVVPQKERSGAMGELRRFERIAQTDEEWSAFEKIVSEKELSREDLARILFAIRVRPGIGPSDFGIGQNSTP